MPTNRRRNPFSGVEMPVPIAGEAHVVPSYSPHWVWLREIPLEGGGVTVHEAGTVQDVTDTGSSGSTWVDGEDPTANHAGEAIVVTGRAPDGTHQPARTLQQFSLAGISGDVVSAILRMYLEDTSALPGTYPSERPIGVHEVTEAWDDDTATWANQPAHDPVAQAVAYVTQSNWYEWDATALVQGWMADPSSNHGLLLKDADEASVINTRRNWTSSSAGSNVPTLRITTASGTYEVVAAEVVPGPGEVALAYDVGALQFHESAAGASVEVSYQGTGSPVRAEDVNGLSQLIGTGSDGTLEVTSGTTSLAPGVYSYTSMTVASGAKLTLSARGTLVIGVTGDAVIEGTIDLDGLGYRGGASGMLIGRQGGGYGGLGGGGAAGGDGGGGGGASTVGSDGTGAAGGTSYPSAGGVLWPWLPPTPGGGGGGSTSGAGGDGGGALLLQVIGTLRATSGATLTAQGEAGGTGGGGGAGGTIWLRAGTLEVDATPDVSGGAGSSGGGNGADGFSVVEVL